MLGYIPMPTILKRKVICSSVLVLFSLSCKRARAQDALVTFYTHGSMWKANSIGNKHDFYRGNVFDGSHRLFSFGDTFYVQSDRYTTLRFAAGPHTFGASSAKGPQKRETLNLDLKAGERYFVRVQGETLMLSLQHGRLDLVSCSEAQSELAHAKPLNDRALSDDLLSKRADLVVDEAGPPSCR